MFGKLLNTPLKEKDSYSCQILYKSSHRRCSIKKGVLKSSQESTCARVFFLNKFGFRPATLLRKRPGRGFFLWILRNFSEYLFYRTPPDDFFPTHIYLFKVNNRNTTKRCEICSNLTVKTPERRNWRRSGVFIVNSEHMSYLFLVFLLLILNM